MDTLFRRHDQYIAATPMDIIREAMSDIDWNAHMIAIVGARGVGKTTIIKQYIKSNYAQYDRKVLYCSLDSVYFASHSVLEMAEQFAMYGGECLALDEVHKYNGWAREIKEIYDLYPKLRIIISGLSLLDLLNSDADLSRRCVRYSLFGLSFREYLLFYKGIHINRYPLESVLDNPAELCAEVKAKCNPVQNFKEYLRKGYYPFFLEGENEYYTKIEQIVNFIIDIELPLLRNVDASNSRKIKALVEIISSEVPYEVDASKIARSIGVGRDTVVSYMTHLADARVFNLLYYDAKNVGKLTKPDKIYMENPNLLYALSSRDVKIGTARETFSIGQLKAGEHIVEYGKQAGDFKVDGKYVLEIGGKDKTFDQIAGIKDSYILADDIESPIGKKLPVWVLGFLY